MLIITLAAGRFFVHKWGAEHARYMAGGVDHPPNCISCHLYPQRDGFLAKMVNENYLSPLNGAVSPDGKKLYVVAQDADVVVVVDIPNSEAVSRIKTGRRPHSAKVSADGNTLYVTNQWANNIYVIDLPGGTVRDSIMTGGGPASMDFSPDGRFLFVANTYTHDISIIDLQENKEARRLYAGNFPTGVAVSPQSGFTYISSQRTVPVKFRTPPLTEITIIKTSGQRVAKRQYFKSAHIMENVAVTPQGDMAITTLVRPKNLVPSMQIERGWMINHGIGIVRSDGKMAQLLLDEPNAFYPDPYGIVIHPNGKYAYVSHSGADVVSIIDLDAVRALLDSASEEELNRYANHLGLSSLYVVKRIKTGSNPKGLAISPDGKYVFVMERMADHVTVIDTDKLEAVTNIDLGGPKKITVSRRGGQLFTNAGHTFHMQYSCYTCHPDGHEDGLTYDLVGTGRDLANVQTLRDLYGTAPFKWKGTNVSVYMQCGMRFSKFVTRTESFAPEDLDAVVAYIMRELTHPPNIHHMPGTALTEAQKRGKALFERIVTNDGREIPVKDRCTTCHNGPSYSNFKLANVGSAKETDDVIMFDAPNLNNVYESAPYLHDGSAQTLEEIWTIYGGDDNHGYVNDMTKDQLNDLVEYLKSLTAARFQTEKDDYQINKSEL